MIDDYSVDQIISLKRDGKKLSQEQIRWFVNELVKGKIADFQASALLMAIYINGCDKKETSFLTGAMLESGTSFNFQDPTVIDKHSTGGIGDKTSLILGPIAAAAGVKVPMISGRGLGHTGGTIDKLESIPGFSASLTRENFLSIVSDVGIAIVGQSGDLAPADKILYALRDLTSTVDSIPLITASIMSKKLAAGTSGLVMDIKTGQGAFMKNKTEARKLASAIRETAKNFNKHIITMLTDMSQPLGVAIGNSNEVIESIETLKGKGPKDVTDLSVELAASMIYLARITTSLKAARSLALEQIKNGKALSKFAQMVKAQGGRPEIIHNYSLLSSAPIETRVYAMEEGYISAIDGKALGIIVCTLGGGRLGPGDQVDHGVGILNHVKIGAKVKKGAHLATVQHHRHQEEQVQRISRQMTKSIYKISKKKPVRLPALIEEVECHWSRSK